MKPIIKKDPFAVTGCPIVYPFAGPFVNPFADPFAGPFIYLFAHQFADPIVNLSADSYTVRLAEFDVNAYFQLAIEFLDYTDEILTLQSTVFGSLDMSRSNSMTPTGQCRIAPLIPCIQVRSTVGQNIREYRLYWATRSSVRSFARTAHSLAGPALLALLRSLAHFTHSLARGKVNDLMYQNDMFFPIK